MAQWPVYVVDDEPADLSVTVAFDDPLALAPGPWDPRDEARRRYVTRLARQRLHQAAFRERVLLAYRRTCSMCRLRHEELLDPAHILPDTHPLGLPTVSNGLALCKLHHAAFDVNIVGVRPDLVLEVRHDVLAEIDGPMLQHGLQGLQGSRLVVPHAVTNRPNPSSLEERYELFRQAG
jgi:putative restriction endonuclease